jgi:hypothetical protein
MRLLCSFVVFVVAVVPALAVPKPTKPPADPREERVNERVRTLFTAMRDGTYQEFGFPKLGWEDVPSLMEISGSGVELRSFPVNPLSSQAQMTCPEGIAALWLIEGIRKGGKFPSLNPLVISPLGGKGRVEKESRFNHAAAERVYRDWWDKAAAMPREKAAALDPFDGTGLHWY